MPENQPELKQAWIRALHREDIDHLKVVNECIKRFRKDVEYFHKVPNGDGTFTSDLVINLSRKKGYSLLLPHCPSYYSSTPTSKHTFCFPLRIERQNVRLVLMVFNDLTLSALEIQNENVVKNIVIIPPSLLESFLPCGKYSLTDNKLFNESCGFSYVLSAFRQIDPLEHHFGLYRMMAGSNYHISYIQILESERRLKLSNILKMFSDQQDSCQSIHTFVKSFTSPFSTSSDDQIDLEPYLDGICDVLSIEYTQQILQSLAFIGGYSVYKFLKGLQECRLCTDTLTYDKEFIPDSDSISQFKLLQLTDRGELKYPSEHVLSSVITLWRILFAIEDNDHLANLLVHGPARKILLELTLIYMEGDASIDICKSNCYICNVTRWDILRKHILLLLIVFLPHD
ncbi:hypothetical protein LOD99_13339 [Oopsacas minuta]|uniref:PH domain-containing protein n=1 Tax=Oopsacas minuta TaxID=111878 RepID=A0AAV7KQR3_9METZ|nr:hypothetical protein LOD99_13339 [Oopsacas minuta]